MAIGIIQAICGGCSCDEQQAQEYLDDELRYLRELREVNDMQHSDIELDRQKSHTRPTCRVRLHKKLKPDSHSEYMWVNAAGLCFLICCQGLS